MSTSLLCVTAAPNFSFVTPCCCNINPKITSSVPCKRQRVFAAKDENKAGNWDHLMEAKFGKLVAQNPKLTLAKIKDKQMNPEHEEGKWPIEPLAKAPKVILWKAANLKEDNVETNMLSSLSLKPNLSLNMGKEGGKDRFSDMILVKNSEPSMKTKELDSTNIKEIRCQTEKVDQTIKDQKVSISDIDDNHSRNLDPSKESADIEADIVSKLYADATLQGRPKRLKQPAKEMTSIGGRTKMIDNLIANFVVHEDLPSMPLLKDHEDMDWRRADELLRTSGRGEVEMRSCSTRGFVVSFGSLIGFLPYRNLATKWKFLAFESWLRRKGVDPATYRKNLGIIGNFDATSIDPEKIDADVSPDMKLEDLLALYDQEKLEYLSTFVGQRIKVNMILADRDSKKLIFSVKPKEKQESIQRKRDLMTKLNVGDVVMCCIKKISYFGIFVEIDGVPALIHETEVSWDALNPTSSFKIGQVVRAKVHQLDFSLERISLSLKEIMPDPMTKALEAVLGDHAAQDDPLEADIPNNKWDDLELLVKELRQYEGIDLVTKGRFFLSPSLTQTFQVYMASMFNNQYKLLARAENKGQEVVVHTWLSTEEMKHAIMMCTKRVE
uniref:uncharacterized protein LOC122580300 n=1 Tax=Erigeron canadensis TaxID=72917 RepID=UPI001CB8A240|nr:uncharacterized protein LOC122580300 [Erigeron canadensis]